MTSCSKNPPDLRRARPLLGTLVEITVPAGPRSEAALEHAFATVVRVHALMNAHDPASDVGRIGTARSGAVVRVHPWTWRVLTAARRFAEISGGAFDPVAVPSSGRALWSDLVPLPDRRSVRCRRRLLIDLGGIAKGFAVDQAVRSLRRAGLPCGLVNAGGDLRSFGPRAWPLHVRAAAHPGEFASLGTIVHAAVATSAPYFSRHRDHGRTVSALLDPRDGRFVTASVSATVFAPTALAADALAKIVLLVNRATAEPILRRYRARAWLQTGKPLSLPHAI
ncbi:MAG: FAD:protein FMN transferase [Undibacterium sp.]|nr:FAD:protein FMN transferase [Opitutaceae bacterium]